MITKPIWSGWCFPAAPIQFRTNQFSYGQPQQLNKGDWSQIFILVLFASAARFAMLLIAEQPSPTKSATSLALYL